MSVATWGGEKKVPTSSKTDLASLGTKFDPIFIPLQILFLKTIASAKVSLKNFADAFKFHLIH
jgi:hypothetical protein